MRFKCFTEEWVKYNIQELGFFERGRSKHRPRDDEKLYGGVYPFIQTGDIRKANLILDSYDNTYSEFGLNQSKLWKKGTLCVTIAANIAESAILGFDACFPDSVIGWNSDNLTNNYYIKYYFDFYKNILQKLSVGGAQENLNLDKINRINVSVPSIKEQEKIINFLVKIDNRIDVQNKIIEDYKNLKNYMIDDFFDKTTGHKFLLSEILQEHKDYHIKDDEVIHATLSKEGLSPKTDRFDRDFLVKDENKKYKLSYLDDICYNPANLKFGVITRNNYGTCIISPIYVTYHVKSGFNPYFMELFVTRKKFLNEIRRYEQGTVYERMAVSSEDFLTYEASIPEISKQYEIVSKCNTFDKKIELEKNQLELLLKQKQYLLQNLFI